MKPVQTALLLAAIVSVCFFINFPQARQASKAAGTGTVAVQLSPAPLLQGKRDCQLDSALAMDASSREEPALPSRERSEQPPEALR